MLEQNSDIASYTEKVGNEAPGPWEFGKVWIYVVMCLEIHKCFTGKIIQEDFSLIGICYLIDTSVKATHSYPTEAAWFNHSCMKPPQGFFYCSEWESSWCKLLTVKSSVPSCTCGVCSHLDWSGWIPPYVQLLFWFFFLSWEFCNSLNCSSMILNCQALWSASWCVSLKYPADLCLYFLARKEKLEPWIFSSPFLWLLQPRRIQFCPV